MGVEELTPETLKDPEILRISRATVLIDDPEMTRISVAKRWAQVTLVTADGREFADEPRTPRGDADSPLSDAEISAKFHAFADPVLGARRAARIADLAGRFDTLDDGAFTELMDLCLSDV
jgi:2-methylcitrate dehydratase PrpD